MNPGPRPILAFLQIAVLSLPLACHPRVLASDWPQYRGANHDGVSVDRIQKQWPVAGPRELWRVPCTNGLSSFAVSEGRCYTQFRRDSGTTRREVCTALDLNSGETLWSTDIGPSPDTDEVGNDDGPRSTPTVQAGRVYVLSSYLVLQCLNATNGAALWRKDLTALYGGSVIGWANGASPLLENGLIFVNCNSASQSLLALRASDGSLAWRSQNEAMTHSSPVTATIDSVRQVIFATQAGLVSLDPTNGARLWKLPYPWAFNTSLAASPLVYSNTVFISANYTMGSFAARVAFTNGAWSPTPLWTNSNYKAHWMSSVCREGFLYGLFGSSTTASLKCIDLRNGAQKWSVAGFGRGGTVLVDNSLMVLTEKGDLVLVSTNTTSYTELARWNAFPYYDAFANKCWNVPAIADGRVYARSTAEAVCVDIAIPPLTMLPPELANGQLRLRVAAENGQPLDSSRIATMQVIYSADLSLPRASWSVLPGSLVLSGGVVEGLDPDAGAGPRFYQVTEGQ